MLSNLVIGPEKLVLFVDHNSYEPFAQKLLEKIAHGSHIVHSPRSTDLKLSEKKCCLDIKSEINAIPEKSNVILSNVSRLELAYSLSDIVHFVHNLIKSSRTKQVFAWASAKNVRDAKTIPFLQYLADIVVTFKDEHTLSVLTKRSTGSVSRKEYQYEIGKTLEIVVREKSKAATAKTNSSPAIDPESFATFKINIDEKEQEARKALKLPYEKQTNEPSPTSQIFYNPDSDDDFDEEDPDEDLNI